MKILNIKVVALVCVVLFFNTLTLAAKSNSAIKRITTPYTISMVEDGKVNGQKVIFGSSYDGTIVCIDYEGNILWENPLSGYFNHDICVYDIDEDGSDEIVTANADGSAYCIDDDGELLWGFKANDAPLYSICAMRNCGKVIIVVGGFDLNFYCLTPQRELLQSVSTREFTRESAWGDVKDALGYACDVNFLRPIKLQDGKELLGLHGGVYANGGDGCLHLLDLNVDNDTFKLVKEFKTLGTHAVYDDDKNLIEPSHIPSSIGHFEVFSQEGKADRVLVGGSSMIVGADIVDIDMQSGEVRTFTPADIKGNNSKGETLIDNFGYRVSQPFIVKDNNDSNGYNYFFLFGSRIIMLDSDMKTYNKDDDVIIVDYSFNDACVDKEENKVILASEQSGGNAVYILDIDNPAWRDEMRHFTPSGNIKQILDASQDIWNGLTTFVRPMWETARPKVTYMSESKDNRVVQEYEFKYPAAQTFLDGGWFSHLQEPSWRDTMSNALVKKKRDTRNAYDLTQQQCIDQLLDMYEGAEGSSYWGGHGNDPHYYSFDTWKKVFSNPKTQGKSTVLIYPEMTSLPDKNFDYSMQILFMPLANLRKQGVDLKLYIRNKDIFWLSGVYLDPWNPLLSGEYADAFVSSMEETSARTMDLSIAGRLGIWAAGCIDSWGTRCARDNPSYDRMRQFAHQMLPSHFLRNMVYHVSMGAQYLDNFAVDQEYMSLLWEMIGKGLLYVPKREEVISFSPVHLAMKTPNMEYCEKGEDVKWTIMYGTSMDSQDNFVFDRLRAGWSGAAVLEWDFSRYAAGVKDRRTNFLPPYPNGLVMITPGEQLSTPYRAPLNEQLHPLYRNIMKTYYTDGKDYLVNGIAKDPKDYYKTIEADIKESVKKLPLNVEGDEVAWVAAQSAPNHIRLTIIDGGYTNPDDRMATVKFHTVKPVSITDLVTGEKFLLSNQDNIEISVPTGLFRFLDVEIEGTL